MVARCIHSSLRWRNCTKIDMEIMLDHDERFYQVSRIRDFRERKAQVRLKRLKLIESSEEDYYGNKIEKDKAFSTSDPTEQEIPPVYVYPCFHKPMKSTYAVLNRNE